jgi:uncharacterized protein YjdB
MKNINPRSLTRYTLTLLCVLACSVASFAQGLTLAGTSHIEAGYYVTLRPSTLGGSWSSSNTAIATVDRGVVNGIAPGTVTISYSVTTGGVTTSAATIVTVEPVTTVCQPWSVNYVNPSSPSAGESAFTIANDGTQYSADRPSGSSLLTVRKYNGSTWTIVGSAGFASTGATGLDIKTDANGTPYVAFCDVANGNRITVMKYDGSGWILVGSAGFSSATKTIRYCKLAIDSVGNLYTAYTEYDGGDTYFDLTIQKFNGTSWASIGSPDQVLSLPGGGGSDESNISLALDVNGLPWVAYPYYTNVRVAKYNGTSWSVGDVGTDFGYSVSLAISRNNIPYVSYYNAKVMAKKYQGGSWTTIHDTGSTIGTAIGYTSIAVDANEKVYLAYQTSIPPYFLGVTERLDGTTWTPLGYGGADGYGAQLLFNPDGILHCYDFYGTISKMSPSTTPVPANSLSSPICVEVTAMATNTITGYMGLPGMWQSNNTAVASIPNFELNFIIGNSPGTATITLTDGTCQQTSNITVIASPSVTASGPTTIAVGATTSLSGTPAGGTWTSSSAAVATVGSSNGIVSGVTAGTANVLYYVSDACGAAYQTVTVTASPITGSLSVSGTGSSVLTGSTPGGTWSTSCTEIATVGTDGTVTGVSNGLATISYTVGGSTSTVVVTVNSTATAITGSLSVCAASTTALGHPVTGGTWTSSDSTVATVSATGVVTGVISGTASISYAYGNGCTSIATVTVNAGPAPITGSYTVCAGTPLTLSDITVGGTWASSAPINIFLQGSAGPTSYGFFAHYGTGASTISYTLSNGCYTTFGVTIVALPTVTMSPVCVGGTTTITTSAPGGYWTTTSSAVALDSSGVITGLSVSNTTIKYTPSSSTACGLTLDVNVMPAVAPIVGSLAVCSGSNVSLTDASTIYGWPWTSSNTTVATVSATGVVTGYGTGTATITYGSGSSCRTTAIVTVNPGLAPITGTAILCAGTNATLSNAASGGTWSSSNATVASINSSTGVVTGIAGGTAAIIYTAPSLCGSSSATTIVTVNALPNTGSISGAATVAQGSTTTLTNTVTSGTWSASNGNATVSSSGVVTGVTAGTVTISYTVDGACGIAIATKTMTVTGTTPVTGTLLICSGSTTTLSNSTSGGTWSSANNGVASVTSGGVVTGGAAGVVLISYTTGSGIATSSVTVLALPNTITGTMSLCSGAATTLASTTTGGSWMSGNTTVASIGSTGIVSGVAAGNSIISYTGINGCTRTATVTVIAQPAVIGTTTLCAGSTTTLTPSVAGGAWGGGSAVASVSNGVVTAALAGTTTITYIIGGMCRSVTAVTVNALPSTIAGSAKVCPGTTVILTDAVTGGSWSSDNSSIATVNAISGAITGVVAGTTTVSYTAPNGCSRSIVATVNPGPAAIGGTASTCAGSTTTLNNTSATYSWTSGSTSIATITSTGIVTGVSAGTANITFTAAGTYCTANTVVTINGTPAAIGGSATACIGSSTTLSNTVGGGNWSSSNSSIASIDAVSGVVTGVTAGSVTMTYATGSGCYKTKALTVGSAVAITGTTTACTGGTITLSSWGSGTWSSSNTAVATIPTISAGAVQGVSAGTAIITFLPTGSCPAVTTVTIVAPPAAITGTTVICSGQASSLSTTSTGGTWSSSNTAVATIGSATGLVNGVGNSGTVTITYAYNSTCRTTTNFTVNPLPNVIGGTYSVCASATTTLSDVTPAGTWSSSNTAVATVGTGINWGYGAVSGLTAGTTNIIYTISATGCARSVVVTVDACSRPMGNETATVASFQLYPNPTTGAFTLETSEAGTFTIFTLDGKEVSTHIIAQGINSLGLPHDFAAGIYMCRFSGANGQTTIIRLVKE